MKNFCLFMPYDSLNIYIDIVRHWRIFKIMIFIETPIFTKEIKKNFIR